MLSVYNLSNFGYINLFFYHTGGKVLRKNVLHTVYRIFENPLVLKITSKLFLLIERRHYEFLRNDVEC